MQCLRNGLCCNYVQALTNCTPNASKDCTCTDGRNGAQTCLEDGSAYSACECTGSPSYDAGLLSMVCVPGESQSCACIDSNWVPKYALQMARVITTLFVKPPSLCTGFFYRLHLPQQ